MLIDRRSLVTAFAAAGLFTKLHAAPAPAPALDATVRIKHQRHPYQPLSLICVGWTPARGRLVYATAAIYSDMDVERTSGRCVADAEAYVRRQLTGPDRERHVHTPYDTLEYRIPWLCKDGSLNWDWEWAWPSVPAA